MLIQPDSSIRLIKNCHIDNSYKDTIYFDNSQEQYTYFRSLGGVNFEKQSYQRFDEGVITLQAPINNVYNSNYLMFRNTAFENKWFYAFVNRVEYVNNVTVRVYYEIDVIQTYMFDVRDYIHPCFIERNHTETDNVGDNLIPENLNIGEYVANAQQTWGDLDGIVEFSVVIEFQGTAPILDDLIGVWYEIGYGVYGKKYDDTKYIDIPLGFDGSADLVHDILTSFSALPTTKILNVFIMPTIVTTHYKSESEGSQIDAKISSLGINLPTNMDGHTVHNNKLFTYPYCCVNVCGDIDSGKDFAFESFLLEDELAGKAVFDIYCPMGQNCNIIAVPRKYLGKEAPNEYAVQTAPYPQCKFVTDKWVEWFNSNALSTIATGVGLLIGGVGGGLTAKQALEIFQEHPPKVTKPLSQHNYRQSTIDKHNINLAVRQGVLNELTQQDYSKGKNEKGFIQNTINTALHSLQGNGVVSNGGGNSIFCTPKGGMLTFTVKTLRNYAAKMIDDYFTMYGYAIQSIEQPQFNNRENFTYIKTTGFSVHGGAPSDVLSKISSIHDSGITYWNKDSIIGDYSQSNRPLLEVNINIVQQPTNMPGDVGDTVYFSVVATGANLSYQWQYYSSSQAKWISFTNETSSVLIRTITSVGSYDVKYRCVITDAYGNIVITNEVQVIRR